MASQRRRGAAISHHRRLKTGESVRRGNNDIQRAWNELVQTKTKIAARVPTKRAYRFMLIILLFAIEFKATPNGKPNDFFYWRQKPSSLNAVQCNTIKGLQFLMIQIHIAGKILNNQATYYRNTAQILSCYHNTKLKTNV